MKINSLPNYAFLNIRSCSRRKFIRESVVCLAAASLWKQLALQAADDPSAGSILPPRKMKICLGPGMIGIRANMAESMRLASEYGFEAIEPSLGELASMSDTAMSQFREDLKAKGLVLGAAGTGMPIGRPADEFNSWLGNFNKQTAALQKAGGKRLVTWISCCDAKLEYADNFRLHAQRVREIATMLADQDISLGLEYIGPKTSWTRQKFPFIHTMRQMRELITETGKRNIGLLLDSWHWYTAGDKVSDILALGNEDVVGVHINDAPAGIAVDQQLDNRRALPASTGVIDIGGFLGALQKIGYDGPIAAEPFDSSLGKLPGTQAVQRTIEAVRKALALAK